MDWLSTQTIEGIGWDWNSLTISFIGTLVFGIIEAAFMVVQMRTIVREGKAVAVPTLWFIYFGCLLMAMGCFGFVGEEHVSLAMLFDGSLGLLMYVPMVVLLSRYQSFTRREWWGLVGSLLMIPAILFLPEKDLLIGAFTLVAIGALLTYPYELWKHKSRGQVDILLIYSYALSIAFWLVYGIAADIVPLMVITPVGLAILGVTIGLWFSYPKGLGGSAKFTVQSE